MDLNKDTIIKILIGIILILVLLISYALFIKEKPNPVLSTERLTMAINNKDEFEIIKKSKYYYKDEMTENYALLTKEDEKQIDKKLSRLNLKSHNVYYISDIFNKTNDISLSSNNIYAYFNYNLFKATDVTSAPKLNYSPYNVWDGKFSIIQWNDKEFFTDIIGKMPTGEEEIMISNYVADLLISIGLDEYDSDKLFMPKNYNDIINHEGYFKFGKYNKVKITGIINYDLSSYDDLKNITFEDINNSYDKKEYYNNILMTLSYKSKGIYNHIFASSNFIKTLSNNLKDDKDDVWHRGLVLYGKLVVTSGVEDYRKIFNEFDTNSKIMLSTPYDTYFEE